MVANHVIFIYEWLIQPPAFLNLYWQFIPIKAQLI